VDHTSLVHETQRDRLLFARAKPPIDTLMQADSLIPRCSDRLGHDARHHQVRVPFFPRQHRRRNTDRGQVNRHRGRIAPESGEIDDRVVSNVDVEGSHVVFVRERCKSRGVVELGG
jgi:hypothetical protein